MCDDCTNFVGGEWDGCLGDNCLLRPAREKIDRLARIAHEKEVEAYKANLARSDAIQEYNSLRNKLKITA